MKVKGIAIALLVGAALGLQMACAANRTPAEQVVLTDNSDAVKGCHFLGQVQGSDPTWGTATSGFSQSRSEIKNQASELGANTVYVISVLGAGGTYGGASLQGNAYDCRHAAAASPGVKPTATADKPQ